MIVFGWVQWTLFAAVYWLEMALWIVLVSCISFICYLLILSSFSACFRMSSAVSGSLFLTSMSMALSLSFGKVLVKLLLFWNEKGLTHCFYKLLSTFDLLKCPVESRSF